MKRIPVLVLLVLLAMPACDVLDVEPYHSIAADQAILTPKDVESAITGCYASLQAVGYYGRNYVVTGDLAADNLTWTGTTAGYNQIDNNSILADNVIVEGMWSAIYSTLSRVNVVIDAIPGVEGLGDGERDAFLAELYFLRALAHFDLVRLFGPVPIRTAPATSAEEDLNVPRQPVNQVYAQVFSDLEFAESHIHQGFVRARASRAAILALKARTHLFWYAHDPQPQHLETAAAAAHEVITGFGLSLEPVFADLYSGNPSSESIFEVYFSEQDRNRYAEYFFPTALSGRREFAPTAKLYNFFASNDLRREASIGVQGGNFYCIKYSDIETGTDNVYVFRLAEMLLIRAEAHTKLGVNLQEARDDVNAIRKRAGLPEVLTTNPILLERQIKDMRQLEFAFEGHRWFDLVRTGQAVAELPGVTAEWQTLFPIPLGELLTNFHEGMYQNEGY
jgi:hypothetical protein